MNIIFNALTALVTDRISHRQTYLHAVEVCWGPKFPRADLFLVKITLTEQKFWHYRVFLLSGKQRFLLYLPQVFSCFYKGRSSTLPQLLLAALSVAESADSYRKEYARHSWPALA